MEIKVRNSHFRCENFATVGHNFEALSGAQIMHMISRFKSWEVRSPYLQTVLNLDLKWRSYGRLKTRAQSWTGISQSRRHLEGCFATAKPIFGTRVPFAAQFPSFWSCDTAAKSILSCEITFELWNDCKMISKLRNGCEITSKHRKGLQIPKLTCEMEEGLQKHFAKLREVAKMPTEPCNHVYEEESHAHPGITHMKPFTPFLTSLNHQSP